MKTQDESTSSSPLGWHYGHYNAVLDHDDICMVHAQMMPLPWLVWFTPHRWEWASDYMLKKISDILKMDKLCLIVVVEGDMNATLKIIWNHRLVPAAEKTTFLAQYNLEIERAKQHLVHFC